ncbi:MAG: hypothetical protein ACKVTZ_20450 [Bacteroidia bacterium]
MQGLGSIGNGLGYGYYLHPHLLVDASSKEVLGLGSISHHILSLGLGGGKDTIPSESPELYP